jgi:hypothetical protein
MNNKEQTIGFWDKGKKTQLIDCTSEGSDIGLKSEGESLLAKNFKSISSNQNYFWHQKWWIKYLVFPILVLIIGTIIISYLKLN